MSAKFWNKQALSYDAAVRKHSSLYTKTVNAITQLLCPTDTVLDFACASGEIGLDVAGHVRKLHGVDISEKMIAIAKAKMAQQKIDNTVFECIDLSEQSLKASSFSAILALDILHLLDDPFATLKPLYRLLTPGGMLISQTPCLSERSLLFRAAIGLFQGIGMAPKIISLTFGELEDLVCSAGFIITESHIWDSKSSTWWILAKKGIPS